TPRSPFMRSARTSAAVPGAPDAVTRTVMSRISRAMLLVDRVDAAAAQHEQCVGGDRQVQRACERHAVRHDVDEQHDVLELDVLAEDAVCDQALQPGVDLLLTTLAPAALELLQ